MEQRWSFAECETGNTGSIYADGDDAKITKRPKIVLKALKAPIKGSI